MFNVAGSLKYLATVVSNLWREGAITRYLTKRDIKCSTDHYNYEEGKLGARVGPIGHTITY